MQMPEAWDIKTGCSSIKIAIIDNGVQLNHPDLSGNLVVGLDAMGNGNNGDAVVGENPHGTKCAGIAAAASNAIGIAGAAYSCKIVPVRAYSTLGGNIATDVFISTAINFASSTADVISMSWTIVSASHPSIDLAITAAINNAITTGRGNKGCILVGAMGNDGSNISTLPTRLPNVLAVGTSVPNDTKWIGTNTPTGICWNGNPTNGNVFTSILGSSSTSWTKISSVPSGMLWSSAAGNLSITFQAIGQQGVFQLNCSNACGSLSKFFGLLSPKATSYRREARSGEASFAKDCPLKCHFS